MLEERIADRMDDDGSSTTSSVRLVAKRTSLLFVGMMLALASQVRQSWVSPSFVVQRQQVESLWSTQLNCSSPSNANCGGNSTLIRVAEKGEADDDKQLRQEQQQEEQHQPLSPLQQLPTTTGGVNVMNNEEKVGIRGGGEEADEHNKKDQDRHQQQQEEAEERELQEWRRRRVEKDVFDGFFAELEDRNEIRKEEKKKKAQNGTGVFLPNPDRSGPILDFAIAGFPKCGTTGMMRTLAAVTTMPANTDVCTPVVPTVYYSYINWAIDFGAGANNYTEDKPLKGSKCPAWLEGYLEEWAMLPKTNLIVGIRHPVLFFQSFANQVCTVQNNETTKADIASACLTNQKTRQQIHNRTLTHIPSHKRLFKPLPHHINNNKFP